MKAETETEFVQDSPPGAQTPVEKSITWALDEKGQPQRNIHKRVMRVQFDIEYGGSGGTMMDPKSLAMPDLHMTVRQLLENHSRGIDNSSEVRQPLYFETELPTINDITDVALYRESLRRRVEEVDNFIKLEREENERIKLEKEAEIKAQMDATSTKNPPEQKPV